MVVVNTHQSEYHVRIVIGFTVPIFDENHDVETLFQGNYWIKDEILALTYVFVELGLTTQVGRAVS